MPRSMSAAMLAVVWTMALLCSASAKTVIKVTSGDHPSYSRVVLDAPGLTYTIGREGGQYTIRFPEAASFGALPLLPRNVVGMRIVPDGMELTVAPAAIIHDSRMGTKIVIDIDDSKAGAAPVPTVRGEAPATPGKDVIPKVTAAVADPKAAPAVAGGDNTPAAARLPGALLPGPVSSVSPGPRDKEPPGDQPKGPPAPPPASRESAQEAANAAPPRDSGSATVTESVSKNQAPDPPGGDRASPPGSATIQPGPPGSPLEDHAAAQKEGSGEAQPEPRPAWPVTRDPLPSGPVAILAIKARPPSGLAGSAIQVPFPGKVGAALFSRGSEAFVIFDERRPIDLGAMRDDPVFGSAVTSIYPAATVIRLVLPRGQSAILSTAATGWRVSVVHAQPRPAALAPVANGDSMTISAESPSQVVTIPDPQTGGPLIIGTQRTSGQGVIVERRTSEFILPITGQGVLVTPLSDGIGLRITQAGFVLSGRRSGLVLSPAQPMDEATLAAAGLTRLFEFPGQTTDHLMWRAKQQAIAAAAASPLARGPIRHARAESLLALGMGAEAQNLLRITMKDDPREAASPVTIGLAAIAALLAGRPNEAADLADPRLTGTDEIALWRAIQIAMADEGSPKAATVLATTAPLLFTYPEEMRRRVMPLALETMILGGEADAAERLLSQRANDPRLMYARALLKQARGDNEAALALFDEVTNSRSTFDHARAAIHATELRLTMGQLDAKAAADALEVRLYAWRGDARELALRLRIAELRRKIGAWREAFIQLRAVKVEFPGQAVAIDRQLKEAFAAVARDPSLATMKPTDLIALLEENVELMAEGPDGEPIRALLAEKLMALDLPKRADPLLTRLMRAAPYGPARAGFGATLATLRLHEGDGDGAILALSESNSANMPDPVRERRALITARVEAKRGHTAGAVEALAASQTQEAEETRAAILEQAKDWPAARDALTTLAARVVPASGMLDDTQLRVMLRLATAAARAGDDATLASLRDRLRTRLGNGPQADLFRLLTAAPVRGTADLGRARTEMGLARAITADVAPKKPAAKTP